MNLDAWRPDPLTGMEFRTIPDDDERWKNVGKLTALVDEPVVYVRISEWPTIKAALIAGIDKANIR